MEKSEFENSTKFPKNFKIDQSRIAQVACPKSQVSSPKSESPEFDRQESEDGLLPSEGLDSFFVILLRGKSTRVYWYLYWYWNI